MIFPESRPLSAVLLVLLLVSGCATMPGPDEYFATEAVLALPGALPATDSRPQFRQVFCDVARRLGAAEENDPECDGLLWRLADEAPAPVTSPAQLKLSPRLNVFVVGGAFSDCFGEGAVVYRRPMEALAAQGIRVQSVPVGGRSGTDTNARSIAEFLTMASLAADDLVVLIGYSKGTVDILQFLVDYPPLVPLVDAVIGVSGPIRGSRLAEQTRWFYDTFLQNAFAGRCDPGEGKVIDSLLPEARTTWLAEHDLPGSVRYYTMSAFTTREHIARGLKSSYAQLAKEERRNDGQVTIESALIPGSTLLGYANSDHWGLAIEIEEELEWTGARKDPRPFPRQVLFESMLLFVGDELETAGHSSLADRSGNGHNVD